MTTDIRAHRTHTLTLYTHPLNEPRAELYCATCDLFMTNLDSVDVEIGTVTIKDGEGL